MKFIVTMRLGNTEGALERVLSRLRQRSFEVSSMSAERTPDRQFIDTRLTIEGTRSSETMIKQLAKLYDVVQLKVQYTEGAVSHGHWKKESAGKQDVRMPV